MANNIQALRTAFINSMVDAGLLNEREAALTDSSIIAAFRSNIRAKDPEKKKLVHYPDMVQRWAYILERALTTLNLNTQIASVLVGRNDKFFNSGILSIDRKGVESNNYALATSALAMFNLFRLNPLSKQAYDHAFPNLTTMQLKAILFGVSEFTSAEEFLALKAMFYIATFTKATSFWEGNNAIAMKFVEYDKRPSFRKRFKFTTTGVEVISRTETEGGELKRKTEEDTAQSKVVEDATQSALTSLAEDMIGKQEVTKAVEAFEEAPCARCKSTPDNIFVGSFFRMEVFNADEQIRVTIRDKEYTVTSCGSVLV